MKKVLLCNPPTSSSKAGFSQTNNESIILTISSQAFIFVPPPSPNIYLSSVLSPERPGATNMGGEP